VVFVENSRRAANVLEKSARVLDAAGAIVHCGDAAEYVRYAGPASFDIIFLDPPFVDDRLGELCAQLDACGILAPGGRVYLEQDRAKPGTALPDRWRVLKDKAAGNVRYMLVEVGA
jgi:16S rRNA (guanine966-N2)-methyltransferase